MLPDVFALALIDECLAVCYIYSIGKVSVLQRVAGFADGQQGDSTGIEGLALRFEWADVAVGLSGQALECAEFHQGGVAETGILLVEDGQGEGVEETFALGCVEDGVGVEEASEDAIDIAVESGVREVVGKGGYGPCRVVAHAG